MITSTNSKNGLAALRPEVKWAEDFVGIFQLEDTVHCLNTIDYAQRWPEQWSDSLILASETETDRSIRDSVQIDYNPNTYHPCHTPLLMFAQNCLDIYREKLPEVDEFPRYTVNENYNVIKYETGQAYHDIHSDYAPFNEQMERRHLTFIMFLNSVADGGELEFPRQKVKVAPEEGRAVIFPSCWTHSHRSLPPSETRYIFQLWWSFVI